ncbi:MAG TPA: Gfo/Idh/MocA family oxidoreductase [Bryobacteraceae bacterium]|nr:Gfo/Idh/MocA family oxidoreductase [Bryobacteraceae bacterium]
MRIHWLVIGIGDITTKRVLPAIQAEPRSELFGIVTRDPAKAAPYPARTWTCLEEALQDPAIDAVYVATPVYLHHPQTIAALRAGKHVLCEKPVALDYAQAREMVETARACGRTLGIAYYRRMYPKLQRARALLAAGVIGRPVLAEINCHDWFNDEDGRRSWLLDPTKSGGGPLYDIASHRIDVLNFLFGRPTAVSCHRSNVVHRNPVEDSATLLIEYENQARGVVDVRWHSRVSRDEFRIVGTEGAMLLTPLSGPELVYPGGAENLPRHANLHYPCVENFVSAVLDGTHLYSSGESAIWTDWVTQQALAHSQTRPLDPKTPIPLS